MTNNQFIQEQIAKLRYIISILTCYQGFLSTSLTTSIKCLPVFCWFLFQRATMLYKGYEEHAQPRMPVYHPSPNVSRTASQLTEEEQVKIAKRLGLISHLPTGIYDGTSKKGKECVICMGDFSVGEQLRILPCMHSYHKDCIDDWLMRSFTCPSCMEPVDAALLSTYETS
ncbi:RING finger protein 11-like isoform X1 [Mercenaria mercenaria]|uniref:RING finger protein 11-like isoform X1 n=1 Tax=Mercenaria mercenaria TaxID=6596 RepID=UPI00234F5042|nr:RING finger protein 11-like isoform X1 [Mercenaria mercenaria]